MKTIIAATCISMLSCTSGFAASSVDGSLDAIAGQIVERTKSDGRTTIGISTFTHSDGTCSDLSNYISEFIVDSLFNAGSGKIDIIERSQLSAIFREMELVFDGTIAPDAAKRLGEIEGVDAVVTGSLIQFGETVKVQARMISTVDGRLFATARSEFPSVGSVSDMMEERSRGFCGFAEVKATEGGVPNPSVVVIENRAHATDAQATVPLAAPSRRFSSDVYEAEVSSLKYSKSKGTASFAVRFKNTTEKEISISYVSNSLAVTDGQGGFMEYKGNWSGLRSCNSSFNRCSANSPDRSTTIAAGKIAQLNFSMSAEKGIEKPQISLGFELVVTPDAEEAKDGFVVQSVGFFDMVPD